MLAMRRPAPLRTVRPSVTDVRFTGDPWIVGRQDWTASLCLGDYCLVGIKATPVDVFSMNQVLDRIRQRGRRRSGKAG